MLEINTILVPAIPACRRANSKLVNLSSATPIPFVRNNFFATKSNNSNFFQAEDGIRDSVASRGLGDVYKRQFQDDE